MTKLLYSVLAAVCLFSMMSCTGSHESEAITEISFTNNQDTDGVDRPVIAHQAYERGLEAGRRIASLTPNSAEREHALIEVHSLVSSLRRNGYVQSAIDFQRGVYSALESVQ